MFSDRHGWGWTWTSPADLAQFLAVEQADPQDDVTQNVARSSDRRQAEAFLDQPGLLMRRSWAQWSATGFHVTPVWYIGEAGRFDHHRS